MPDDPHIQRLIERSLRGHKMCVYFTQGYVIIHKVTGKIISNITRPPDRALTEKIVQFNVIEWDSFYSYQYQPLNSSIISHKDIGYWMEENGEVSYVSPSDDWRNQHLADLARYDQEVDDDF